MWGEGGPLQLSEVLRPMHVRDFPSSTPRQQDQHEQDQREGTKAVHALFARTLRRGTIAPHIPDLAAAIDAIARRDQRWRMIPRRFLPQNAWIHEAYKTASGCIADRFNGPRPAPADLLRYRDATDLRYSRRCLGAEDGALLVQVWIVARKLIDDDSASVVRLPRRCNGTAG